MRLKHFLYLTTLVCALAEIGMALYAMYWGDVLKEVIWTSEKQPDAELIVVQALNIALPVGICCIGLLIWTWKVDAIGGFALFMAVILHMIGFDVNVRAVKKVYGNSTSLAAVTWWAPAEDRRPASETDYTVVTDGRSS